MNISGQEEPGQDERLGDQAAGEDQDVQEADRGGRGDRRPQPGQVQESPAGTGGDGGKGKAGRSTDTVLDFRIDDGLRISENGFGTLLSKTVEESVKQILFRKSNFNSICFDFGKRHFLQ